MPLVFITLQGMYDKYKVQAIRQATRLGNLVLLLVDNQEHHN